MLRDIITRATYAADSLIDNARSSHWERQAKADDAIVAIAGGGGAMDGSLYPKMGQAKEQLAANRQWVYACTRLVAQKVAGQEVHVARDAARGPRTAKAEGDDLEPLASHDILDAIDSPLLLGTRFSLLYCTVASLELTGRSIWWVQPGKNGKKQITYIPTHWFEKSDRDRTYWRIRPYEGSQTIDLPGDEVVHFYYPDPADPLGVMSPVQAMAKAINTDDFISTAQSNAFQRGIFPQTILHAGRRPGLPGMTQGDRITFTSKQRAQIIQAIKTGYQGVQKFGDPIILDGLIENTTKLSNTPQEMDFPNSAKLTKDRITQGFIVSDILLGAKENSNRNTAAVAREIFVDNRINPLCSMLSQAMTRFLGPMFGGSLRIWLEPAQPNDREMQLKRWGMGAQYSVVTVDEFRKTVLNLPAIGGEAGSAMIRPSAAIPGVGLGGGANGDGVDSGDNGDDSDNGDNGEKEFAALWNATNPYSLLPLS
jgi:phage portal protein BeeE